MKNDRRLLRGQFARNLRRVLRPGSTISDVCRAVRINRQQFNKYLAGDSLPTPHNMRKICSYFGVTEEILLAPEPPLRKPEVPDAAAEALASLDGRLDSALATAASNIASQSQPSISPGYYFLYFPMIADPSHLIRSLVIIHRRGKTFLFNRFTKVREAGMTSRYYPRGRHSGIVLQKFDIVFMLAVNRFGFQDINLMTFTAVINNSPSLRTGIALVMSPWAPLASRVTLEFIGRTGSLRQLLKQCRVVPIDSPEVDPIIRRSMELPADWPVPHLEPYGLIEGWHPPRPRMPQDAAESPPARRPGR